MNSSGWLPSYPLIVSNHGNVIKNVCDSWSCDGTQCAIEAKERQQLRWCACPGLLVDFTVMRTLQATTMTKKEKANTVYQVSVIWKSSGLLVSGSSLSLFSLASLGAWLLASFVYIYYVHSSLSFENLRSLLQCRSWTLRHSFKGICSLGGNPVYISTYLHSGPNSFSINGCSI